MSDTLSQSSSSSSFVPVDQRQLNDAIQIIDQDKVFNEDILNYIHKSAPSDVGNNYHIISVFGSQSTGKSTLLNRLFHTNFDVMDETNRQQTTKGIWLGYSPVVSTSSGHTTAKSNIIVMDVEGTDGRERGEDQDFERKAALFALATSEILIINIWETQIGLYQGANMGLLKTVFEVNLTLFGKSKMENKSDHKVLLLFVIRDHIGVTSLDSLSQTLKLDLINMWDSLSKPSGMDLKFDDFFDINFHALNHKVLQPKEFEQGINSLGDRLIVSNELFKPEYHHSIPIDGWTLYAEKCWEQIENNKDLDLPTQQILVAQFKCDEIVDHEYNEFLKKFAEYKVEEAPDYEQAGLFFIDLRNDVLENYDQDASRYNSVVYNQRRTKLKSLINGKFKKIFETMSKTLIDENLKEFESRLIELKGVNFYIKQQEFAATIIESIILNLGFISLQGDISTNDVTTKFKKDLDEIVIKQQKIELENIITKSSKKLGNNLSKFIQSEISNANEETWDTVLAEFNRLVNEFGDKYKSGFELGTSSEVNLVAIDNFKAKSWTQFYDTIHKLITKEKLLVLLHDRFDDKFRYDENGLPKLYQNANDLEKTFAIAKGYSLKVLPILTIAKLKDGSEIVPEYDIFKNLDEEEDEKCFAEIIDEQDKAYVLTKFKKEIDAKFVETKRSIIQHITSIPYYIYIIIVILGWNEFMAVIRNPLFFSLLILIGASLYILYTMNLLKPAMVVGQRMIDEGIIVIKDRLREVLIDDHVTQGNNLSKIGGTKERKIEDGEEIEMQDMNSL